MNAAASATVLQNTNLLANPDFEAYTGSNGVADGWKNWTNTGIQGSFGVVSSPVTSGSKAQRISASAIPSGGINVQQQVKVDENTTYTISGRLLTELMVNSQVEIVMYHFDKNDALIGIDTPVTLTNNTYWITVNGQFKTPANAVKTTFHVHLSTLTSGGTGAVYLDSMSMIKGIDANLLYNPDFETYTGTNGVADGWGSWVNPGITHNLAVVSAPVSSGTKAQLISANVPPSGGINVHQQVKIEGNTTYTVSGRLKTELMENSQVEAIIYYFDKNDNHIGSDIPVRHTSNTHWITFNGQFTSPANAVKMTLHIHLSTPNNKNGKGTLFLDSMRMVKGADANLLANPNFETYTGTNGLADGWGSWVNPGITHNLAVVSAPVSSGTKAQLISANVPPSGGINVYQEVKIEGNTTYTVSGRLKTELMENSQIEAIIYYFDKNNNHIGLDIPVRHTNNTHWITFNGQFTSPANAVKTTLHIHLSTPNNKDGKGSLFLDSMRMVKGADSNLLANPDFESYIGTNGVADEWGTWVTPGITNNLDVVSTPVSTGNKAQKISAIFTPSGGINVHQQVKVDGNTAYTVSGRLKTESMANSQVEVIMYFFDKDDKRVGLIIPVRHTGNNDWITYNGQFTTPTNTVKTMLHVHLSTPNSNKGTGTIYLDSLRLVKGIDTNLLTNPDFETYTGVNGIADNWSKTSQGLVDETKLVTKIELQDKKTAYIYNNANQIQSTTTLQNGVKYKSYFITDSNGNLVKRVTLKGTATLNPIFSGTTAQQISGAWIPINGVNSLSQSVKVEPNKNYTLTSAFNVELLHKAKAQLVIEFYNSSNQLLDKRTTESKLTAGQYVTLKNNGLTPAGSSYAKISLQYVATAGDAAGTMYVDALNFKYE
nr:carbohydrate binding domain-containing protein [Paenibacillus sp. GSMTC-2017]